MRKILLVSDSKRFLERNKSFLEKSGFSLFTSTSAREALQIQRELRADLIITMLDLPEMSGDMLCSLIRHDRDLLDVPIIAVCYDSPEALQRAALCGANAWVRKPVQPQLLLEEVGKLFACQMPRQQRVALKTTVSGTVNDQPFLGVSHNISASGLLFETSAPLVLEEVIKDISIDINSSQIVLAGKVVRSVVMPDGITHYGIRFMNLANSCLQEIYNFIAATGGASVDPQIDNRCNASPFA